MILFLQAHLSQIWFKILTTDNQYCGVGSPDFSKGWRCRGSACAPLAFVCVGISRWSVARPWSRQVNNPPAKHEHCNHRQSQFQTDLRTKDRIKQILKQLQESSSKETVVKCYRFILRYKAVECNSITHNFKHEWDNFTCTRLKT